MRTDATPVASGLAVAGRVALPGSAAAVVVAEDAVWVLLEQGTLLRVDPDASGRRQPVGWLTLGPDAVWTVAFGDQRLWRVPLGGGPAGAVVRVGGFLYGLASGAGVVWVLPEPSRCRT